jgi:hypothetical protein
MRARNRERFPKTRIGDLLVVICEEQTYSLSKADLGKELGLMVAERIRNDKTGTTKSEEELLKVAKLTSF